MTDQKAPRRVCPICQKSFMNARALKAHRWELGATDPAHRVKPPVRIDSVTRRTDRPTRVFDLTTEKE